MRLFQVVREQGKENVIGGFAPEMPERLAEALFVQREIAEVMPALDGSLGCSARAHEIFLYRVSFHDYFLCLEEIDGDERYLLVMSDVSGLESGLQALDKAGIDRIVIPLQLEYVQCQVIEFFFGLDFEYSLFELFELWLCQHFL